MAYNSNLPQDVTVTVSTEDIRENFRALKDDKIVAAATAIIADTAVKLANARKISLVGDAKGNAIFDGSADITINTVINGGNADTVDGKHASDFVPASYGVPVSTVVYLARQTAPEGWLKANGSAISRTQYADLFAAIGIVYGKGDGSTTFNLPDLRGEFMRGFDDGRGVDTGRLFGSGQDGSIQSHYHDLLNANGNTQTPVPEDGNIYNGDISKVTYFTKGANTCGWVCTSAAGSAETRPRNIALLACIKY